MSALPFDTVVEQIMRATSCDRATAEFTARANGITPPAPDLSAQRRADVLEKAEQAEVMKLFRSFGFTVYSLSQARASKQTPGIPDLWCMHQTQPIAFWFETKRQKGGHYSKDQIAFRELATLCGVGCYGGDRYDAQQLLVTLGLAFRDGQTLEPVRRKL